jgi:hypothetical protein
VEKCGRVRALAAAMARRCVAVFWRDRTSVLGTIFIRASRRDGEDETRIR